MSAKPNLFIIGAPKCGTTSISQYLKTHPDIFVPKVKEPHYFANDFNEFRTYRNLSHYLSLYKNVVDEKYLCDASVWYMYSEIAIKNISQFNPDARLIIILRNPLEMLPSLHQQLYYTLDEDIPDFKKAWNLQQQRKRGMHIPNKCREVSFLQYNAVVDYATQLERLFKYFHRQQIHIILFDHLRENPAKVYQDILDFLGLEDDSRTNFPKVNTRKTYKSKLISFITHRPPKILTVTAKILKNILNTERLNIINKIASINEKKISKIELNVEFKRNIIKYLKPSIQRLEKILDEDLSSWYK